jgi:hypothetical protein
MEKKEYKAPEMEIVDFEAQACLLAGSGVEQTNCVYDDELG